MGPFNQSSQCSQHVIMGSRHPCPQCVKWASPQYTAANKRYVMRQNSPLILSIGEACGQGHTLGGNKKNSHGDGLGRKIEDVRGPPHWSHHDLNPETILAEICRSMNGWIEASSCVYEKSVRLAAFSQFPELHAFERWVSLDSLRCR